MKTALPFVFIFGVRAADKNPGSGVCCLFSLAVETEEDRNPYFALNQKPKSMTEQRARSWNKKELSKEGQVLSERIRKNMYRHLRKDGEVAMFAVVDQAIKTEVALKYPGVINVWTRLNEVMDGKRSEFEDYLNELGDAYRIKLASEKHNKEFEEIKEVRMAIRMKESDYERLEVMAKEKGVKVSSLCRNILGNTALENVHIDAQLKRSFLGMGVNLNQLAYHYNRTGENPPKELKECLELLKLFRDAYSRK